MTKKQMFSLNELILVIAVCALAAGAFHPFLARVQADAVRLRCVDNLKRLSDASFAYVDRNNDYTVPHLSGKTAGWPLVLMSGEATLAQSFFHCPDDGIARNHNAAPISYSLNLGHIWNCRQSSTNQKEWGTASALSGTGIRRGKIPQPSETVWYFENHDRNNNFRQMWQENDRSLWTPYTIAGFHDRNAVNNMIFMDGSVNAIRQNTWTKGDNRGILFKNLHTPENCVPNLL